MEREELAADPRTSELQQLPIIFQILTSNCTRFSDKTPLSKPVTLGASDTLKILLTATEDGKPKRPHQAFLLLTDEDTGLEATFPLTVKDTGKGKVDFVSCGRSMNWDNANR